MATNSSSNPFRQRTSADFNDFYTIKFLFNGLQLHFSLVFYQTDDVRFYEATFLESAVDDKLIKAYGTWQDIYVNCFEEKLRYELVSQGLNKAIRIPYQKERKSHKTYDFQLKHKEISKEQKLEKLKQLLALKDLQTIKLKAELSSCQKALAESYSQLEQSTKDIEQMKLLCSQAAIPLFVKNRGFQDVVRGQDPNEITYSPKKPDERFSHIFLNNKINPSKPFIVKLKFSPFINPQNHSIGIVSIEQEDNIVSADFKVTYQFSGVLKFGVKKQYKCESVATMRLNEIMMKIYVGEQLIQFKRGGDVFASASLKDFRGKKIRPFIKIGQLGATYNIGISC